MREKASPAERNDWLTSELAKKSGSLLRSFERQKFLFHLANNLLVVQLVEPFSTYFRRAINVECAQISHTP